jgi:uncharacterized protein YbbC (DUF1343 family)
MKLKICIFLLLSVSCLLGKAQILTGADRTGEYLELIRGKKTGITGNHTTLIGKTHLVDSLLSLGINIVKIYCPEHGFRGTADAGQHINTAADPKTGIAMISLYGKKYKPGPEDLAGIDIMIFDIQDVGVRFYTYISTLYLLMEACAENKIPLVVLDRPNPNGFTVDGPMIDSVYMSFVGKVKVPLVHGMTIGELAKMFNGEGWLKNGIQCNLTVIPCEGWDHTILYQLPVKPSPNLPTMQSVYLYPSLGLFEGTVISVGRGTEKPFEVFGHPAFEKSHYRFIPVPRSGANSPPFVNTACYGFDLTNDTTRGLSLKFLITAYHLFPQKDKFFSSFFEKLAGNKDLRKMIQENYSEETIRETWKPGLVAFRQIRAKYLLYKDAPEK